MYVGEGLNSSIAVSQFGNTRQFHVSGKSEASTGAYDMRLQRMLVTAQGAAPSKAPIRFSCRICGGSYGRSFVVNPDVQRIVICEVEPLVPPTTTKYFNAQNYNALNDPRTEVVYEDARNYILTTPEKFDIITSDPIRIKGSVALYTKEYFELVKAHFEPGGIVTQWGAFVRNRCGYRQERDR